MKKVLLVGTMLLLSIIGFGQEKLTVMDDAIGVGVNCYSLNKKFSPTLSFFIADVYFGVSYSGLFSGPYGTQTELNTIISKPYDNLNTSIDINIGYSIPINDKLSVTPISGILIKNSYYQNYLGYAANTPTKVSLNLGSIFRVHITKTVGCYFGFSNNSSFMGGVCFN
jgi:hypothetical protein